VNTIPFDEPHPYTVRSFSYHTDHVRTNEEQKCDPVQWWPLLYGTVTSQSTKIYTCIDMGGL